MSDFSILNQQNDVWSRNNNTVQNKPAENKDDFWNKYEQDYQIKKQKEFENRQLYGVSVPDEIYEVFNQVTANCKTPEEAREMSYKLGSACRYLEMQGLSWDHFQEAFDNVDNFNAVQFPNLQDQKSRFEALSDSWQIGKNNVKLGELGQKLMKAHRENDTELANSLMAEINAINQQNVQLQDNVPRHFIMQELEAGAQSLPFTGAAAAAGVFGNFIVPGAGTAASFAVSSYLATGSEYVDMIANGSSPETARTMALISGGIQGLIEANLGITKGIVKGSARLMGKEAAESFAKNKLKEIESKVLKRVHFGPVKRTVVNYLERRAGDVLGEGAEEFWQETTSIFGKEIAAALDGYDIPDDDFKSIVKQTTEAFKGGVLGALGLGLVPGFNPARLEAYADIHNVRELRNSAEMYGSEEMFKKAQENNPIFDGLSKEEKERELHDVYQGVQNRMEEKADTEARKIAEIRDAGKGKSQPAVDENGNEIETEVNPVARNDSGRLFTQVKENKDDDGNVTGGTFLAGDRTQSEDEDNRYGYIKYSQNENGDITIDNFYMKEEREGLRQEVFEEFAREHPDVNIEWNTKESEAAAFKDDLIKNNPSGEKNGLNYYSTENLADIQTEKELGHAIRENFSNVKAVRYFDENNQAQIEYKKTPLTSAQVASTVALFKSLAQRDGKSLSDFLSDNFVEGVFGTTEDLKKDIAAYNQKHVDAQMDENRVTGGFIWKDVEQGTRAVIYAAENADYLTLMHELAHFYQSTLTGKLKEEAEAAFGVEDGNWKALSKWKGDDGEYMTKYEAFAYYFQDYITTGRVKNQTWKNVFDKFAQFLAQAYTRLKNHLTFTPEIENVFEKMLGDDKSVMAMALKAAKEEEAEYKAMLKRNAEEKQAQQKAEAAKAEQQAEAEREAAAEYTDFENKQTEQSTEEIESKLDEVTNETEKTDNAIDNALENTNLTDDQKEQIAETLKDESSTVVDKAEATTEAAASVYDDSEADDYPELMFQLAGEPSIRRMAESEERERILADLEAAQLLDSRYKSMDAKSKASRIRMMTGWEKDANGKWKYETDDSVNRIKTEFFKNNPGVLNGSPYLLNLGDILEADELYKVFPYMKNVRVSFYSDPNAFRAVLTPQGIKVNTRYLQGMEGEKGLKGVLAHEIQHIIQAMEYAESKGLQGADIEQLYKDMMNAMQAAGERKYDYDITSLQQGLDAYMQDAGEIEARNVARRILMNKDQRRMNTLASTEDVQRPEILFQQKFKETGESEWGTTYEMEDGSPLEAAKFLMQKKDGLVKNVFVGKNKDGKSFKVGLCWGDEKTGLSKIIDKHIIELSDFETIEELVKTIQNILTNGKRKDYATKAELNNGSYRLVLAKGINGEFVITAFNKAIDDKDKERTEEEKVLKREELNLFVPNSITQKGTPLPETASEKNIAQEVEAVKQKYQNTDKWLKAPNGEDSNLEEKQWLQVRTPSFKKWFGDWENDPENASKVLDENGEPLVVYHGTDANFTIFDASKSRANMDIQGNFFSPWDIDAQGYGPNVRAFYLNIRNPANSSQGYSSLNTYKGQNEAGIKARELLKSKGFDGVNNDNEEYITFEPNQIKSATDNNGNFDANNPDILFQIAGEIGAENLDNSEVQEGVSRMQNLAIAKQMEAEGKDAPEIRIATGWEKGDDGYWRYEIDDSKIKVNFNPAGDKEFYKLDEVLENPELYKAYPTLKNVDVYIGKGDTEGLLGEYEPGINTLSIYTNNKEKGYLDWVVEAKKTVLHEVQHIIQQIEGFARGGDIHAAGQIIELENQKKTEIKNKAFAWEWKIELEKQEETHPELKGNLALMNSLINDYTENGKYSVKELEEEGWLPNRDIRDKGFNLYVRGYDKAGFEDAYKKWQETASKKGVQYFDSIKDTDRNRYRYYKRFAGEVESRNVETRINYTPEERLLATLKSTEDVWPTDKIILFQTVYHGSGADFDKFDTENYGFSGEGSMSFGYGTYVTDNEDIARDYADRQVSQKYQNVDDPYNVLKTNIIATIIHDTEIKGFEKALKERIEFLQKRIENSQGLYTEEQVENSKKVLDEIKNYTEEDLKKRRFYTVEIPDDGYLEWNEPISKDDVKNIVSKFVDFMLAQPSKNETKIHEVEDVDSWYWDDITGSGLYQTLEVASSNRPKLVSQFLHSIGYAGIKYPAGTIHGNGNGAYNYVIFNDDDAKIVDKLLFQTQAELMDEARKFASWQDFMNYCQLSDDEQNAFENDEAWYKSFWEQANAITKEQEKKAEAEERRQEAEADTPEMVDRLFISYIKNNPEVVDNFVQQVSDIMEMDLGSDEWAQVDEEGGRERERYAVLQDYISAELRDGNWQTAIAKVQGGHEITDYIRKRLVTEMTDSYKARDFRNLYAAVMKEKRFTVDALDTRADELLKKLEKNPKRYFDILAPTEDVTVTTPQRRKEIAREMQNRDMAARIKAGSLKVDDEVINYLKSVEKKEKDLKKQEQQLTDKIQGLYNDVGNTGLQMLINTHEKLMEQKARLNNRNADTQRKIEKGLRMTDRYTRQTQDMTQTYHELERKFSDLKDSIVITSEVQQILDAQEQRREIREEVARLTKERYLADETKKIRVNLVKQLFRKVPLDKVDFKQAQLIIAIQKLTLPNMIGGVNRWIGRNSPFLNAVLSRIVTDSEYKERIVNYLEHVEKQTDTFRDFVESIRNAKSREDFESWGVAERDYAIKYLPKENWVWELKLKEKARDLQESLHLDITQEKVERQVYDADGHPVEDDEGKPVMETAYQFKIGDEALNKLLQETLGDELFNRLMNSPMVEWSTQEMEELVARVNQIRDEGITMRAAKLEARKREAQKFIQQVADAVKDTGIVINDDDTPEEKEKKLEKINKILGKNKNLKGTEASKDSGFKASLNRILHGYKDANVLRVARILDNQKEGVNTYLLYRKEDDYYNKKMRSIMSRGETVNKVMAANNINEGELAKNIEIKELETKFTVDELLFFLAADKDFQLDENGNNDNYAATSRNAVCFGNMMSDTASQDLKEGWAKLDAEMKDAIEKDLLTPEQRQLMAENQLDTKPGTTAYIRECNRRWDIVLKAANELLNEKPEYNALLEAIQADYADQYERMNEVSISEFNVGVNRVKCYVPLVRRESNGDTNEYKVMEDLLAINGVGKSGVNKGMTQSRQTISPLHQKPVQTGLFRTWCDSVERTEHFIAYAPYVRLLNRVYKSNDAQYLRRTIEGRYGKGMLEYIDAYINEVANPNAQNTRSTGAELLHILRGKTAPAYLGWKASAIIKQGLTSPWPYMQFVNPAEYLAACFKCNNPKMWEAIQEKSVFMKNRRMDPINDLVDEMAKNAKNKADKFWSSFTKTGMQGLEWIDWVCVAPGWYACYEKKYNQLQKASEARYNAKMAELEERNRSGNGEVLNPTQMETLARQELLEDIEVEAITYADDCTRQCQPSNRLTDLAPMFKDKNEFKRAFLQFQTSLNVIWQNLRYDMPYAVKNKEFGRIVGTVLGYTMAGIFMNSVMDGITNGADDDDDKDKQALRNLVFYATTQFTDAVPMIGSEITNMVDQAITGKRGFMNSGTDMTPTASKLFSAFTTASKGNWQKAAELTAEGIGLFLGAPVSGAKEINKLLGKPLDNGEVDIKAGISDVYGIAGDILEE